MLCLLLVGIRKKRKEKQPGAFFPGMETRHTLLAVPGGIFDGYLILIETSGVGNLNYNDFFLSFSCGHFLSLAAAYHLGLSPLKP
jgi:uncharacterized 2Fe-2S/4Fe-4S cluster protein (DUF4445 family)